MAPGDIQRRELLLQCSAAAAVGLTLFHPYVAAQAFPGRPGEEVISWADQPPPIGNPTAVPRLLRWEDLDSWITPNERFFVVGHYGFPAVEPDTWRLEVTGLVGRPRTFTLDEIKARPRHETVYTMECSGNHGNPWLTGAIGNARWAGTPLAPILQEAGLQANGTEVVFFGTDTGEEEIRQIKVQAPFARSMSVADATSANLLLCYEMNGQPLPRVHGFPLRLIAPGWFGVANVKWLNRIDVRGTRFAGRFMGRDYVTIREEQLGGRALAVETSVGPALLKSAPARVTRLNGRYRILGAAWGAPIARVEVRVDEGPWRPAVIDRNDEAEFAWKIWSLDWDDPSPGEHTITSRAIDTAGRSQPAMDDPSIVGKRTYWESNGHVTRRIRFG